MWLIWKADASCFMEMHGNAEMGPWKSSVYRERVPCIAFNEFVFRVDIIFIWLLAVSLSSGWVFKAVEQRWYCIPGIRRGHFVWQNFMDLTRGFEYFIITVGIATIKAFDYFHIRTSSVFCRSLRPGVVMANWCCSRLISLACWLALPRFFSPWDGYSNL